MEFYEMWTLAVIIAMGIALHTALEAFVIAVISAIRGKL